MIQWQKYFDKIYCINYKEFQVRHELMEYELKRVGILDSPVFEWQYTFSGPYEELYAKMISADGVQWSVARTSCILGHINAVKKAYYNGYNNVLIIEDDERFLRNIDRIEQILEKLPKDYDLIFLDKFINGYNNANQILTNQQYFINDQYIDIRQKIVQSAGCYILNRRGMEIIISLADIGTFLTFDMIFNLPQFINNTRRAIAKESVSIQVTFSKGQTSMVNNGEKTMMEKAIEFQRGYKFQNIDFDNYMMRKDGSPFYYGDYIEE